MFYNKFHNKLWVFLSRIEAADVFLCVKGRLENVGGGGTALRRQEART